MLLRHARLPVTSRPRCAVLYDALRRCQEKSCFGGPGGSRTHTLFRATDFESVAAASFATRPLFQEPTSSSWIRISSSLRAEFEIDPFSLENWAAFCLNNACIVRLLSFFICEANAIRHCSANRA